MSAEVNQDVEQEVVQPTETEAVQDQPQPQKGSAEYNFGEMRKLVAEQNRQLELQARRLQELENSSQQPASQSDEIDVDSIDQDAYLTKRQAEAIAYRQTQEMLYLQERAFMEDKMRIKCRDYDEIVTRENIDELIRNEPDLELAIKNAPNPFATAYSFLKKVKGPKQKQSDEAEKIVRNAQKPVSSNAIPARPLATANQYARMTATERDLLNREMIQSASRR